MYWSVDFFSPASAKENMDRDYNDLIHLSEDSSPSLRFYSWKADCATYGYFLDPSQFLDLEALKKEGLDCARRPTGGGILFHMTDLAFSVLVPSSHAGYSTNTLANYAYINNKVTEAIHKWSGNRLSPVLLSKQAEKRSTFCMAQPTRYDVMIDGKKVGGAAQRRMKQGFLHQGTISLWPPSEELLKKILLPGSEILEEMQKNSYFLLSQDLPLHERLQAKKDLRQAMEAVFLQN